MCLLLKGAWFVGKGVWFIVLYLLDLLGWNHAGKWADEMIGKNEKPDKSVI